MTSTTTSRHRKVAADSTGRGEGNERLTAMTGAVLLVLLAAEGATILRIHQLLTVHFFIGMLLIGPVLLKMGSTGYRFVRYYTGSAEYVRKGSRPGLAGSAQRSRELDPLQSQLCRAARPRPRRAASRSRAPSRRADTCA